MKLYSLFTFLCILQYILAQEIDSVVIFQPYTFEIDLGTSKNFTIRLAQQYNKTVILDFTYGDENKVTDKTSMIKMLPSIVIDKDDTESKQVEITALDVGHLVIGVQSAELDIPTTQVFRLSIIHSKTANVFIDIIGWIYFIAWSVSFYPQVILNFKSKDVSGLSLDFIALNFLGFSCYSVFNSALFWDKEVQKEYFHDHPRGVNPVLLNDVIFSFHAVAITLVTIVQCLIYKQRRHRVSYVASGILVAMVGFLTVSGVICGARKLKLLDYIYFFSYVKLVITIMKYCPQAYLNYKRKSTIGWSIGNVLLDFTGGSFSLLQMFLLAYNYNDWTSIFGSPTKLGLGLLSIFFDIIFMVQHYVLYRSNRLVAESYQPIQDEN